MVVADYTHPVWTVLFWVVLFSAWRWLRARAKRKENRHTCNDGELVDGVECLQCRREQAEMLAHWRKMGEK